MAVAAYVGNRSVGQMQAMVDQGALYTTPANAALAFAAAITGQPLSKLNSLAGDSTLQTDGEAIATLSAAALLRRGSMSAAEVDFNELSVRDGQARSILVLASVLSRSHQSVADMQVLFDQVKIQGTSPGNAILVLATAITGTPLNEIKATYGECDRQTSSEARAVLTLAATMSHKGMPEMLNRFDQAAGTTGLAKAFIVLGSVADLSKFRMS